MRPSSEDRRVVGWFESISEHASRTKAWRWALTPSAAGSTPAFGALAKLTIDVYSCDMPTPNPYLIGFLVYLAAALCGADMAVAGFLGAATAVWVQIAVFVAQKRAERLFAHQAIAARADYEFDHPDERVRTHGQFQPAYDGQTQHDPQWSMSTGRFHL